MRINFVVPLLESSGGARIIAGHARMLADRGHEVIVLAPTPRTPGLKERLKALLGFGALPAGPEYSHCARANLPIRFVRGHGPLQPEEVPDADVIIATFWATAEWIAALPDSKGVKVHFMQHYEDFPGIPTDRLEAVWRLPTRKIAIAEWLVNLGRERFGIEEIALVPNSIDHHLFHSRPRRKGDALTVGFLFSAASFKDIPTSIAAVNALKAKIPKVRIVSFGANRPMTGQLPIGTEFHFRPSQDAIAGIYARSDAWLSTSITEGFNLPPLEAMASGCPAVCSKTGRPLEIIEDGINGYLVDQGDVAGFADALARILSLTDEEWQKMSAAAVRAVAHPTWAESSALFEQALVRSIETRVQ